MKAIQLSERAVQTPPSPIRRLAHLARQASDRGSKVYYLNIGQPDIATPPEFFEGVQQFDKKVVAYDVSEGNPDLRQAWADYINHTVDLQLTPDNFLITTGASEALVFVFMTCCDPGDGVLIFDPTYANYIGFAAISGVKLVSVVTKLDDNFALPGRDEIVSRITNRTRAILLCSPNNPTGTVYSKEELQMLLDICNERDIFLIVDETYREIVYDGRKPFSVFNLDPDNPRIIVVDSLSKRYSLCGARLGCMITPNSEVLAKALNQAQARLASPTIEQFAAAHMLRALPADFLDGVRQEYENRRNVLHDALNRIPKVVAIKPDGAFYTVVRLPVDDAEDFASFMLSDFTHDNATVFVAPAAGFYMDNGRGKNKIRIACVLNTDEIQHAVEVLDQGLQAYRRLY